MLYVVSQLTFLQQWLSTVLKRWWLSPWGLHLIVTWLIEIPLQCQLLLDCCGADGSLHSSSSYPMSQAESKWRELPTATSPGRARWHQSPGLAWSTGCALWDSALRCRWAPFASPRNSLSCTSKDGIKHM